MTQADHLSDDILSLLVDEQLSTAEQRAAQAHLDACPPCAERLADLRTVAGWLHRLPEVEPARDFSLGPRLVAEPANVVRLQRWYTWSRAAAASLAAVFVFLVAGTVYLDSVAPPRTFQTSAAENGAAAGAPKAAVPAPAAQAPAAPAPAAPAAPAAQAQAPRALSAAVPQTPVAGAARAQSGAEPAGDAFDTAAPTSDTGEQVAAATRVQPLPTAAPTAALPQAAPTRAPEVANRAPAPPSDPGAPLRLAASIVGSLAVAVLLGAFVLRHRLGRTRSTVVPTQE